MNNQKVIPLFWAMSVLSKGIYTFVWYSQRGIELVNEIPQITYLFAAFGLVVAILGVSLSKKIDNPPEFMKKMINHKSGGTVVNEALSVTVISLGMIESVAVLGLANSFLNSSPEIFFGFIAVSLIGWALAKPQISEDN